MGIWLSVELEELRDKRWKKSGRIAFDCFNLLATPEGRGRCSKGHYLGQSGTVTVLSVLRGETPSTCKSCLDFDGGEDEI